jgi:hypothetical protein
MQFPFMLTAPSNIPRLSISVDFLNLPNNIVGTLDNNIFVG